MERILVLGASGLLGNKAARRLARSHTVITTYYSHPVPDGIQLDLRSWAATNRLLDEHRPSVVLHMAGIADVEKCDNAPEEAWELNVEAIEPVIDYCLRAGASLVYASTDYVFCGNRPPYGTDSPRQPVSLYGKMKKEVEDRVMVKLARFLIPRMDKLYGNDARGMPDEFTARVVKCLREQTLLCLDNSQVRYPTLADDAATFLEESVANRLQGVCHIPGPRAYTRYTWAQCIARYLGVTDSRITPTVETMDNRPNDATMIPHPGVSFRTLEEGLRFMKPSMEAPE